MPAPAKWRHWAVAGLTAFAAACSAGDEHEFLPPDVTPGGFHVDESPVITLVFVAPLKTAVGSTIQLSGTARDPDGDVVSTSWSAVPGVGAIAEPQAADTTYTCRRPGKDTVTFLVSDGRLRRSQSVGVICL